MGINLFGMKQLITFLCCKIILLSGCSVLEQNQPSKQEKEKTPSETREKRTHKAPYQPTPTKKMDLVHTKLDVQPNWQNQTLDGKATLTFTPHFYPVDSFFIDAKRFDLKKVALVKNRQKTTLNYHYGGKKLKIHLPRTYQKKDTFRIFIRYKATLKTKDKTEGSVAGSRGLFFINPEGKLEGKPRQIWTQGETEYSSYWFPTLDRPNEKTTQEIYITVDTQFQTLSNGIKVYSVLNADGTRTDYWKQKLPHAPYLFMMAIGDYAVVKDKWRDSVPVNYYVEPEYKPYARMIFSNTKEMMDLYSNLFGYDYPWAKYSQVAVRDFIATAMENTSATIHFSGIQQNRRGYLSQDFESLIAHELIHHWFGNLVTCESWANIALNEAFATYGEYLWKEHKYGKATASIEWQNDKKRYLREARRKQLPLIQFHYTHAGKLFDAHRYQKGACILHMLRAYLGDKAFFAGVEKYLEQRAFKPAEHHHLRLALESVSGKPLKWFFDQWFRSPGHPELDIKSDYDTANKEIQYIVEQTQNLNKFPTFKLPVTVAIYQGEKVNRQKIWIENPTDTFRFSSEGPPELINFDAKRNLLAEKTFHKSLKEWFFQFRNAPLYLDQYEAFNHLSRYLDSMSKKQLRNFLNDAINNPHWPIRKKVLSLMENYSGKSVKSDFRDYVLNLAKNDPEPDVRAQAYQTLANGFRVNERLISAYKKGLKDSAYHVVKNALKSLASIKPEVALKEGEKLKDTRSDDVLLTVAEMFAQYGGKDQNSFFRHLLLKKPDWKGRFQLVDDYLAYLERLGISHLRGNLNVFRQLTHWIADDQDRKKLIKELKILRNKKQKTLKKLKAKQSNGKEEKSDHTHSRKYERKANLIDALNQLIEDLKS